MTDADTAIDNGAMLHETAGRIIQSARETATQRAADQGVWPAE